MSGNTPGAHGIDVASYQGYPNWESVRTAGIEFAYIKAGEGNSIGYTTLNSQYNGARGAGLTVGLYHYARTNLSPEANADSLAAQVTRLGAIDGHLPPCLDLEEGTGDLSGWASTFVERLRARTGCRRVMVYSGASFFGEHIGESWMDDDVSLWIAHYGRPPGQPRYLTPRVAIHQHSSAGKVAGITGNVDLDFALWPLSRLVTTSDTDKGGNDVAVMPWVLPAGTNMEKTIPVPSFPGPDGTFDPDKTAVMWMVTGWTPANIRALYFIRDRGPNLTPQQEEWGGTSPFGLRPDDRPSFPLPVGCTSIAATYDAPHDIAVMVVYPAP